MTPALHASALRLIRILALLTAFAAVYGTAAGAEVPFLVGADVSALPVMEAHHAVYRIDGKKADGLSILRVQGFNCFRLRLFVDPNKKDVVTNDLEYTIALAKRVKALHAAFMLDIHYSDTWADPAKQFKPASWANLSYDELKAKVQSYTTEVLKRFAAEGVKPQLIQLGNEITNGMLWPEGHVEFTKADDHEAWARLGGLLRAAYAGLANAFPDEAKPLAVLHIESPNQFDRALWFCREATAAQVPFDIIGMSYYPDWHGSVQELSHCLNGLAAEFKKPLMVVETAYPWKNDEHWKTRPHMTWPLTPAGQRQFISEVYAAVKAVPNHLGRGVFWWYPEATLVEGLPMWVGGSCALFDDKGAVLPAAAFSREAAK
ncbi:MAG: glycosyl hydrolase 53 family protein [Nibricoccus sp.]